MNQKSKLWLTMGTISASALAIAPIAVVASCATTVSPSQAVAEALEGADVVKFDTGKGEYTRAQINEFAADKKQDFLKELKISLPANIDPNQFTLSINSFTPDIESNEPKVKFTIDVKNKNDENEPVATSKLITLAVTLKDDSVSSPTFK